MPPTVTALGVGGKSEEITNRRRPRAANGSQDAGGGAAAAGGQQEMQAAANRQSTITSPTRDDTCLIAARDMMTEEALGLRSLLAYFAWRPPATYTTCRDNSLASDFMNISAPAV